MTEEGYFFKKSLVNKEVYLQIWYRDHKGKAVYVDSIGNAKKAARLLVKLRELPEQTKKKLPSTTKSSKAYKATGD